MVQSGTVMLLLRTSLKTQLRFLASDVLPFVTMTLDTAGLLYYI